jgi:hypothetical protein
MHSDAGDTTQLVPGYPIRTPWDHSSVDSSPRPIAASHVLHRLLVPRHPPFALDNLTTKMLASTMQISTNNQPTTPHPNTSTTHKPQLASVTGMPEQAMPGMLTCPETQTHPDTWGAWPVLSGLNRVSAPLSIQPHQPQSAPRPAQRPCSTRKASRCQLKVFASVSAN